MFTTVDSVVGSPLSPVTLSRYLYGDANPLSAFDPDGRWSLFGGLSDLWNSFTSFLSDVGSAIGQAGRRRRPPSPDSYLCGPAKLHCALIVGHLYLGSPRAGHSRRTVTRTVRFYQLIPHADGAIIALRTARHHGAFSVPSSTCNPQMALASAACVCFPDQDGAADR